MKRTLFIVGILGIWSAASTAAPVKQPHVRVELLAAQTTAKAGDTVAVAVRFQLEPEWHVYWRNPGDSGEAVRIAWKLPAGAKAGPIEWPAPSRINAGPMTNFGYEKEVWLPTKITLASDGKLAADVSWLVCHEECIPGKASFEVPIQIADTPVDGPAKGAIENALASVPRPSSSWKVSVDAASDDVVLTARGGTATQATYFPFSDSAIQNAEPQKFEKTPEGFTLRVKKSSRFVAGTALDGVLTLEGADQAAFEFTAAPAPGGGSADGGFWQALLFAFLGGMILNLMPCVFPVLFIKILNFVELSGSSRRKAVQHSLAYTLGILACFWALAGALIALRASGNQLGWGFQLQSPIFLSALCLLLLAMSMNLMGVFEVGTSWMGVGQKLADRSGYPGSFFSGALAVVVATPCTAPFMGTAMGFALGHSALISLLVFTALGLGLAAPYVLLSAFPHLTKRLPRPGKWMVAFKELMAFPLLATVIWLISVLGIQTDLMHVVRLLSAMLILGMALWLHGKQSRYPRAKTLLTLLLIAGALYIGLRHAPTSAKSVTVAEADWIDFTESELAKSLESGRPVFIDFTAAWCITCQVNKKLVFDIASVKAKFAEKKVILIKADWTNQNDEISKRLEIYGRNGVPLYVLYKAGQKTDPKILPQLLTPEGMIKELDAL